MTMRALAVLPVGPACNSQVVADTVASIRRYLAPATPLIVIDNSRRGIGAAAVAGDPAAEVLVRDTPQGRNGALWVNLAEAFRHGLERYDFDLLLRIDTDALVVAPDLVELAAARFAERPAVAALGAYRIAATGGNRTFDALGEMLEQHAARDDDVGRLIAARLHAAKPHGYGPGEHVLGGVCLYHRKGLDALARAGLLEAPDLARTKLPEDVIFSLFLRSLGWELGDFAGPGDPIGAKWRGLPADPPSLLAQRRCAIHSIRSFGSDWDETRIRAFFQGVRETRRPAPRPRAGASPLAVVMPVAPDAAEAAVVDTVASLRHGLGPDTPIVFAINAGSSLPPSVLAGATQVVERAQATTTYGPLAVTLGHAFRAALRRPDWRVVLRFDVDGLLIGPGLAEAAQGRFEAHPHLGMIGAYHMPTGGGGRDVSRPAALLRREAARPDALGRLLTQLRTRALSHGYDDAEHVNGCVSLIHRRALEAAEAEGLLGHELFEASELGEDILLALVMRSLGFAFGEFAGPGQPLGVKWRGLPYAPPRLLAEGRAAIHSVRRFDPDWSEARIRGFFQGVREAEALGLSRPAPSPSPGSARRAAGPG